MQICWINLARATQRRHAMESQLQRLGLAGERIEAVTPADIGEADRRRFCNARAFRWLSESELSCCLSHVAALRRIARSGAAYGLVLEDDAVLSARLPAFLAAYDAAAPAIDVTRLESVPDPIYVDPSPAPSVAGVALRRVFSPANGSAGYIVRAAIAAELAERLPAWRRPVDRALFSPYGAPRRLAVRHADPGLCRQYHLLPAAGAAIEASMVEGAVALAERRAAPVRPRWLEIVYTARRRFETEVLEGVPKTLDVYRSGASKRVVPFDAG